MRLDISSISTESLSTSLATRRPLLSVLTSVAGALSTYGGKSGIAPKALTPEREMRLQPLAPALAAKEQEVLLLRQQLEAQQAKCQTLKTQVALALAFLTPEQRQEALPYILVKRPPISHPH